MNSGSPQFVLCGLILLMAALGKVMMIRLAMFYILVIANKSHEQTKTNSMLACFLIFPYFPSLFMSLFICPTENNEYFFLLKAQ